MAHFYCSADGTGVAYLPVDWSLLSRADKAACPSHALVNGGTPRIGAPGNHRAATADEMSAAVDAASGATTATGEALLCPHCLAPVRVPATAATWTPPGLADPAPRVVYKTSSLLVGNEAAITSADWQTLGRVTTNVAGLVEDVSMSIGAIVGEVEGIGGGVDLRLVMRVNGIDTTIATSSHAEGLHPYIQTMTAVGAPVKGPCAYLLQGKLTSGVGSGFARGISLALYEVQS